MSGLDVDASRYRTGNAGTSFQLVPLVVGLKLHEDVVALQDNDERLNRFDGG